MAARDSIFLIGRDVSQSLAELVQTELTRIDEQRQSARVRLEALPDQRQYRLESAKYSWGGERAGNAAWWLIILLTVVLWLLVAYVASKVPTDHSGFLVDAIIAGIVMLPVGIVLAFIVRLIARRIERERRVSAAKAESRREDRELRTLHDDLGRRTSEVHRIGEAVSRC